MKINQKGQILKQYINILENYKYVLVLHTHKLSSSNWIALKNQFCNLKVKMVHNNLLVNALNATKYKNLSNYIVGPNIMIYSNEKGLTEVKDVLKDYKESLTLLFAIAENSILQKNEFSLWMDLKSNPYQAGNIIQQIKLNQASVHNVLKSNYTNLILSLKQRK